MTTIAEAVNAEEVRDDSLYRAAKMVQDARCLPQETKDALIGHISAARAKHPLVPEEAGDMAYDAPPPPTRPSKFAAATAKVAKATKKGKK